MKEERDLNREKVKLALGRIAEQAVPAEVDLWPVIRARMETSKAYPRKGESSMKASFAQTDNEIRKARQGRLLRIAVALTATVVLATAALLATPQGRAWARNMLLFFTRGDDNTRSIPTQAPESLVEVTAVDTPVIWPTSAPNPETLQPFHEVCGSLPYPHCTVKQIGEMVDFPVKELAMAPEGLAFTGATGGPEMVILLYQGDRGTLYLAQSPVEKDDLQEWEIAADTLVEAVSIGNLPGEYVQGGWAGLGIETPGEIGWEQESGKQTLRWEQDGIRYSLWFYASKSGDGPILDKFSMVEMALRLRELSPKATDQGTTGATGQSPFLTLEQAASRAGFEPVEPAWLPAGYMLAGATYSPDKNAICLHYRYRLEAAAPSLTLFESYGWLPTVEEIKIEEIYNGQPIDIPTSIQSLEIGGSEDGFATLASNGVNLGSICGGMKMTTNKALLWRTKGMNFVLGAKVDQFQGRGFLSNLEMRRVAESLTGVTTVPADALDYERLTSMATLKSLAGFPVKTPTRMLAELHFDHAVYREPGNEDNPFRGIDQAEEALLIYLGSPIGEGSDGRFFNIFIAQSYGPDLQTLEETALGGEFEYLAVDGQPALHRLDCWDDTVTGGFAACMQTLAWFEEGVRYDVEAFLEKALPVEMLIAIAESMR